MMLIPYYLGISHAVFGFALLISKRPKHISNEILGVWILILGVLLLGRIIQTPVITFFKPGLFPFFLCFGPFLFFYIKSLTIENFEFKRSDILHFFPFLLVILHRSFSEPINFEPDREVDFLSPELISNFIYYSLATLSITVYTVIGFVQINRHKDNLKNIYSYPSSRYTLTWLRIIISMFLIFFAMSFVSGYYSILFQDINMPYSLHSYGTVFFIITSSFFGVNQPAIFSEKKKINEGLMETDHNPESKYQKSGLSGLDMVQIENKISSHLTTQKPYLNPEYTINMLADEMEIPRHHVTQVINSKLDKKFYTLINEMRVNEVVERLQDETYGHFTLLAIAFDSGFNSKSAFNRVFKLVTGKTPSQYKATLSV